jgi:uroporphyrinogen decarboxylase
LRGTENLFMDLAYGDKNVYKLRDMLHEFFIREMEMWADTDVDGITFMDDWGTQKTLLISPKLWREFYKPLYKDYCDIMHSRGKFVFFHSDGNIESIYPDLIEIGIDAVNSQLFCMDIERLGELYAGKITFWGEIDRQHILPFGTPEDVRNAVARVAKAMLRGKRTGVIAQCEWGIKDPKENIETVFEEWNKI